MKKALITGAGRGLGQATALELARGGWSLGLVSRTEADLKAVAEAALEAGAPRAMVLCGDVSSEVEVQSIFEQFVNEMGGIDALVTAAGTGSFAPILAVPAAEWRRILDTNLTGMYLSCRQALAHMRRARSGQIINVLSIASRLALPGSAAYTASKWGAMGFTKVLTEEARKDGIRVTALSPGATDTSFWEAFPHSFTRSDMLRPEEVAVVIRGILEQPATIFTEEIVITPPKGVL